MRIFHLQRRMLRASRAARRPAPAAGPFQPGGWWLPNDPVALLQRDQHLRELECAWARAERLLRHILDRDTGTAALSRYVTMSAGDFDRWLAGFADFAGDRQLPVAVGAASGGLTVPLSAAGSRALGAPCATAADDGGPDTVVGE